MNWQRMKQLCPELAELERHAKHAGRNGASWTSYLLACHESLTKLTGRGATDERLMTATCYEVARHGLFEAWARGRREANLREQSREPSRDVQGELFDTSCPYT